MTMNALDVIDRQLQRLAFKMAVTGCQLIVILGRLQGNAQDDLRGAGRQPSPLSLPGGRTRLCAQVPERLGPAAVE